VQCASWVLPLDSCADDCRRFRHAPPSCTAAAADAAGRRAPDHLSFPLPLGLPNIKPTHAPHTWFMCTWNVHPRLPAALPHGRWRHPSRPQPCKRNFPDAAPPRAVAGRRQPVRLRRRRRCWFGDRPPAGWRRIRAVVAAGGSTEASWRPQQLRLRKWLPCVTRALGSRLGG